jgi:hypothetical protein
VFGFGIGINVCVPRPPSAKRFLLSSSGYECCFHRHSGPHRVRILSIWNRWRVRYTSGWSPVLGRLYSRSPGTSTQVAVIIGEVIGHFSNDAIMRVSTRRNKGVFEAESRLWWVRSACLLGRSSNSSMVGPANLNSQGMLHWSSAVHLWFPSARRRPQETRFGWRACNGMGYCHGRAHGEYRSSLCVPYVRHHS